MDSGCFKDTCGDVFQSTYYPSGRFALTTRTAAPIDGSHDWAQTPNHKETFGEHPEGPRCQCQLPQPKHLQSLQGWAKELGPATKVRPIYTPLVNIHVYFTKYIFHIGIYLAKLTQHTLHLSIVYCPAGFWHGQVTTRETTRKFVGWRQPENGQHRCQEITPVANYSWESVWGLPANLRHTDDEAYVKKRMDAKYELGHLGKRCCKRPAWQDSEEAAAQCTIKRRRLIENADKEIQTHNSLGALVLLYGDVSKWGVCFSPWSSNFETKNGHLILRQIHISI